MFTYLLIDTEISVLKCCTEYLHCTAVIFLIPLKAHWKALLNMSTHSMVWLYTSSEHRIFLPVNLMEALKGFYYLSEQKHPCIIWTVPFQMNK